jgi:signal transduction histidine kinase
LKFKVEIVDTGVGISEENLDRLFSNFSKLDEHSQMNPTGTGLGLSICKELVEQMGGKVGVESVVGQGTTFSFEIMTKGKKKLEEKDCNDLNEQ